MTPLFAAWARYLYRARHQPRLVLLAERAAAQGEKERPARRQDFSGSPAQ